MKESGRYHHHRLDSGRRERGRQHPVHLHHGVASVAMMMMTMTMTMTMMIAAAPVTEAGNSDFYRICSLPGGLEATRLASRSIQGLFRSMLEDVEFMRETVTEGMSYAPSLMTEQAEKKEENRPLLTQRRNENGQDLLDVLSHTLDWEARGLPQNTTTLTANLGYVDDRPHRRVDRWINVVDEPIVGSKAADMAWSELLASTLPWIVDRRSKQEYWLKKDHQNGRVAQDMVVGPSGSALPVMLDKLYTAAYTITAGGAAAYYPPLSVYAHPFTLGDVVGAYYRMDASEPVMAPNLPQNNPQRITTIGAPYADRANPGLAIVTIHAPVYFTGSWYGYNYNDTYLGLVGIDITISAMSEILKETVDGITEGGFAFVVDLDFNIYIVTQTAVDAIYPERTGMEEYRVFRDEATGSIVDDRRNQTYLSSDTILQSPINLTNAAWTDLRDRVQRTSPGQRGYTKFEIQLTGDDNATSFYAMYERWSTLGDFALLMFAPVDQVENAIHCVMEQQDGIFLQVDAGGQIEGLVTLHNHGTLSVVISDITTPQWIHVEEDTSLTKTWSLSSGEHFDLHFVVHADDLPIGQTANVITMQVQADGYPNCFYNEVFRAEVSVYVAPEQDLQQIGNVRYYGVVLSFLVVAIGLGCSWWVFRNNSSEIVRASQPIFLYMLCTGNILMGLSIIPISMDDSLLSTDTGLNKACMAFPWLAALGFSIAFSALFSKVWRVHQLFQASAGFQRRRVLILDAIIPFCIMFSLNVGLLLVWTLYDPLTWDRVIEDESKSYGTCWSDLSGAQVIFMVLIICVDLAALILANIQAFLSRNLAEEFSESKYIAIAMASLLQIFVLGVPVLFLVMESSPTVFYFVQASLMFLIAMTLQLLIFVPKMFYLRSARNNQDEKQRMITAARKSCFASANSSGMLGSEEFDRKSYTRSDKKSSTRQQNSDSSPQILSPTPGSNEMGTGSNSRDFEAGSQSDADTPVTDNKTEGIASAPPPSATSLHPEKMVVGSYAARVAVSDLSYESQDFRSSATSSKNIAMISGLESLAESPDVMPLYEDDEAEECDEAEEFESKRTESSRLGDHESKDESDPIGEQGAKIKPPPLYGDFEEDELNIGGNNKRPEPLRRSTASKSSKSSQSTSPLAVIDESDCGASGPVDPEVVDPDVILERQQESIELC